MLPPDGWGLNFWSVDADSSINAVLGHYPSKTPCAQIAGFGKLVLAPLPVRTVKSAVMRPSRSPDAVGGCWPTYTDLVCR